MGEVTNRRPEFPPAETKCQDCGCCLAKVYSGDVPICFECDASEPCKGRVPRPAPMAVEKAITKVDRSALRVGTLLVRAEALPTPARNAEFTGLRAKFDADEQGEKAMPTVRPKKTYARVSDETRAAILAADLTVSNCELGRKYGMSDTTVYAIRKKAGLISKAASGVKPHLAVVKTPIAHRPAAADPYGAVIEDLNLKRAALVSEAAEIEQLVSLLEKIRDRKLTAGSAPSDPAQS